MDAGCEVAKGAKWQRALRPKGAKSQTARSPKRREVPNGASRPVAHYGTRRIFGARALTRRRNMPALSISSSISTPIARSVKKIGFLSFGRWSASRQSAARSAHDVLQQSIELAVAAEELGAVGAYFRVHHFAQQLASPFPLLAAVGARTSRIEIGTAVIDMRYEN